MEKKQLLTISFFIWFLCILIGAVLKIMHLAYGEMVLIIAIISYVIFACMVIYEVYQSRKIVRIEKSMWVIGMLFFGAITGLFYMLVGRKHVVENVAVSKI